MWDRSEASGWGWEAGQSFVMRERLSGASIITVAVPVVAVLWASISAAVMSVVRAAVVAAIIVLRLLVRLAAVAVAVVVGSLIHCEHSSPQRCLCDLSCNEEMS